MNKMTIKFDLIILGSGPAGYTAAIYAKRANLHVCIIQGDRPGGQLMITTDVENWPGGIIGLQGPELMASMHKQVEELEVQIFSDHIISTDLASNTLRSRTDTYVYKALIICTGANAKFLGLESEERFMGMGVSACATCDGFFYKNKTVAVVGGGNTALEEALYLSNICSTVYLIHRRDTFRAEKILQNRVKNKDNIICVYKHTLQDIKGDDVKGVNGIVIKDVNDTTSEINLEGVFIAIGHKPNTDIFREQLQMKGGYIVTKSGHDEYSTMTSISNVFAAGDVVDYTYRQAVTSAGEGCKAALDAEKYLEKLL